MAIGITGANNGYSRTAADNRFFSLTGGTINGNVVINGSLSASQYLGITGGGGGGGGDYLPLSGGTVNGNLTITGTLCTTLLEALSANITVLDIKQYELSGFNVTGNATVQGTVSASGNLLTASGVTAAGVGSFSQGVITNNGNGTGFKIGTTGIGSGYGWTGIVPDTIGLYVGHGFNLNATPLLSRYALSFLNTGTQSKLAIGLDSNFNSAIASLSTLTLYTGSSATMSLTDTARVGIGTSTPLAILDVSSNGDTSLAQIAVGKINHAGGIRLRRGSDGAATGYIGYGTLTDFGQNFGINSGGGGGAITFTAAGGPVTIYAGNVYPSIFAGNGSVGINTLIPTAKLDVVDTTLAGSGGLSGSVLKLTQTWNTSGSPTAITLNVTNSASGAASNLIDLQVDGVSKFRVEKDATITRFLKAVAYDPTSSTTSNLNGFQLSSAQFTGVHGLFSRYNSSSEGWVIKSNGAGQIAGTVNWEGPFVNQHIGFAAGATHATNPSTFLWGTPANTLELRNGVNPQESRIYGTYTSATNFERLNLKYNATDFAFQIGTAKGSAGGAARPLELQTDGTTRMTITSAGLVSIMPNQSQTVNGTGLRLYDNNAGAFLEINQQYGDFALRTTYGNQRFAFYAVDNILASVSNGVTYFVGAGNFGIGTFAPSAKLDVVDTTLAGSGGLSGSVLNLTQTWSTSSSPTAIQLNVTDTSSNAASLLMDLRVGARSSYAFGKTTLTLPPSAGSGIVWSGVSAQNRTCSITRAADDTLSISAGLGNGKYISIGGDGYGLTIFNGQIQLNTGLKNVYLSNDDNHILTQRNGGNPQAFRLYNTYTNTTTFERLNLQWDTNVFKFGTEKGSAGGLARSMEFQTDGTTRMAITSGGNVGIGTTTPSTKLEVVGSIGKFNVSDEGYSTSMTRSNSNLRFTGFNLGIISFAGTADGYTTQQIGAQINSLTEGTGAESWQLRPAANLLFHTTPNLSGAVLTERMRITGAGNVGIGTTTPSNLLHIDCTLNKGILLTNSTQAPGRANYYINAGQPGAYNAFNIMESYDGILYGHFQAYARSIYLGGFANAVSTASVTVLNDQNKLDLLQLRQGLIGSSTVFRVASSGNTTINGSVSIVSPGTSAFITTSNGGVADTVLGKLGNMSTSGLLVKSDGVIGFGSGQVDSSSIADVAITRGGPANLHLGIADNAAPVAQTLSVQSVVAGTTNLSGSNFTIAGSQGTGTGVGGSIIFQTAPAGSSGTAQNPLSSSIVIDGQGVLNIPAAPVGNTTGMLRVVHEQTGVLRPGIYATSYGDMSLATYGNGGPANIGCMYSKFIFSKRGIVVGASGPYAYNQTGQVADGIYFGGGASTTDISLGRDAAGILAQRDNINPQAFRLYNTFTDTVSAFERLNIKWDAGVLKLGTEKGSTGGLGRAMEFQTDGTTQMTITSAGNVGISTTTPSAKLDVNLSTSNTYTTEKIIFGPSMTFAHYGSGYSGLWLGGTGSLNNPSANNFTLISDGTGPILNAAAGGDVNISVLNSSKLIVKSTGNVGIGTTAPSEKLSVAGSGGNIIGLYGSAGLKLFNVDNSANTTIGTNSYNGSLALYNGNAGNLILSGNQNTGNAIINNANTVGGDIDFQSRGATSIYIKAGGNVGIGTTTPTEKLDVVGNAKVSGHFSAATKSFLIDHPTKAGKKLQYGVVESDQHSVLVRGKTSESIIELPEEWAGLVHEDSVTVQLTPIGSYQPLFVVSQDNQRVVVGGSSGQYNYTIYGERKDVDKLITEI